LTAKRVTEKRAKSHAAQIAALSGGSRYASGGSAGFLIAVDGQ
jgi:hypothetical protein